MSHNSNSGTFAPKSVLLNPIVLPLYNVLILIKVLYAAPNKIILILVIALVFPEFLVTALQTKLLQEL